MYLITVVLKSTPQVLQFHYDDEMSARSAYEHMTGNTAPAPISDDYGSKAHITLSEVAAIFITDLDREMIAQQKVEVAQHKKTMKVQAEMQNGSASILSPRKLA